MSTIRGGMVVVELKSLLCHHLHSRVLLQGYQDYSCILIAISDTVIIYVSSQCGLQQAHNMPSRNCNK